MVMYFFFFFGGGGGGGAARCIMVYVKKVNNGIMVSKKYPTRITACCYVYLLENVNHLATFCLC